ncbi:MAG: FGGY-family carbohydrate kinase [Christensenellales bacterium]|jgi:glycerol kinase
MKIVVTLDQSTAGTKAALMDETGAITRIIGREHRQFHPAADRVEHDAEEIWQNAQKLLTDITQNVSPDNIAGLGIANQRETTVIWNRKTGRPVSPAIVWQDVRAKALADGMQADAAQIEAKTGLKVSPYYSAAKAAALLRERPELQARAEAGELCFGTVDSYLLYRLTGGRVFATDISNASRTQLLNLETLQWDAAIVRCFGLPVQMLPDHVWMSDANYGEITTVEALRGVRIGAVMGDSHASFYGHGCTEPGMVKTSYGTGSSIMMNTGSTPLRSSHGLSTSVGYGKNGLVCYVLEGNITCSADTLMWLKNDLQLMHTLDELALAQTVPDTQGVYLIPAFAGLGAPWFDENARAILYGMNRGTGKAHVLRAALESIAHQNADVLDAMRLDTGKPVEWISVDGGGSVNTLLMQMQSDLVPCRVQVSAEKDLTLYGIGRMVLDKMMPGACAAPRKPAAVYEPALGEQERKIRREGWADALRRCR